MFERLHHQRIARVLEAINADLLREYHCYFAGGTAIALREGEFRESVDIDFVISDPQAYRGLRELLHHEGLVGLFQHSSQSLMLDRPLRMDQYGLRTRIGSDGHDIKLEIIREARLVITPPSPQDQICGVSTATVVDLAAMKLLANADRWADDSVFSRDIIDLAHLSLDSNSYQQALKIAEDAYGLAIRRDLQKALDALRRREGWLDRCLYALAIATPKALVWKKLRRLRTF